MMMMRSRCFVVAVAAMLAHVHHVAAAQDESVHEVAKRALAAQDHAKVVQIYEAHKGDLTAGAHYRMAIAHGRMGNPVVAYGHLQAALSINPGAVFASSSQRVDDLGAFLLKACEQAGAPGCKQKPAVVVDAPVEDEQVESLIKPTASQPGPVEQVPHVGVASIEEPPPAQSVSSEEVAFWKTLASVSLALLLGTLAYVARKALKKTRRATLEDLYRCVRDQSLALVENTPLQRHLAAALPLIEREVGRAQFAKSGLLSDLHEQDRQVQVVREKYVGQPIRLADASPEDVKALFQGVRWKF